MPNVNVIGPRIRQARRSIPLSQTELANRINAHVTSLSDWERGKHVPSPRHLVSIARVTGHPLEFFLTESEESDPDEEAALRRFAAEALVFGHYDMVDGLLALARRAGERKVAA
jgi:transcriptional regulator with XRE-family HTH domain